MADAKIILLCNNRIAIPALRELLFFRQVAVIIVPSKNKALMDDLKELIGLEPVPVVGVDRNSFRKVIGQELERNKVDAVLIMTFPYLIPRDLLDLPPKGFINFHYGKLPEYRGPEPIFTQVMMQEREPAVTVHVVTEDLDSGPVILLETVSYDPADTYGMLQYKLADAGAKLVRLLLKILAFGSVLPSVPQDESKARYHTKPTAASLMINWETMDSSEIRALVNACNPWNKGCGAALKDQVIGITEVEVLEDAIDGVYLPGTIIHLNAEHGLQAVSCDNKIIQINIVYTEQGIMSGKRLADLGIEQGHRFN